MEKNSGQSSGLFTGFLLGTIAGFILGLLFAPRPGKDTREEWKDKLRDLVGQGKQILQEAIEEGKEAAAREQAAFRERFSSEE